MASEQLCSWAAQLRDGLDFSVRLRMVLVAVTVSALYLKLIVTKGAPGAKSFALALPVVLMNMWMPLMFSKTEEIVSMVSMLLALTWLASFKALGLCMNRGPLVGQWTFLQFIVLYMMPVYPKTGSTKKGRLSDSIRSSELVKNLAMSIVLLCVSVSLLVNTKLPTFLEHYTYALGFCSFISIIMDGPGGLMVALLDLELVPPFDCPWFMTSLADFWGRRWNNSTSLMLRSLVYDPLVEKRLIAPAPTEGTVQAAAAAAATGAHAGEVAAAGAVAGKEQQREQEQASLALQVLGTAATFAVSGVMHEVIVSYIADPYLPGYLFMFFFSQAPLMILEKIMYRVLKQKHIQVPMVFRRLVTNLALLMTAHLFFFPPVMKNGLADLLTEHVSNNIKGLFSTHFPL